MHNRHMQTKELFKSFWNENGSIEKSRAPLWVRLRGDMSESFPTYYRPPDPDSDPLAQEVSNAIARLNQLKPEPKGPEPYGPAYIGQHPAVPDYNRAKEAELPKKGASVAQVINEAVQLFDGMPNWSHPLTMPNVIPPANTAGIIGAMLTDVLSPNIIEGEYSWNVEFSELESAAMLAKLVGWSVWVPDSETGAGGLFTFGGSGCYLYGLKYALTRVLGKCSRRTGIRTNGKLLVSQQGHYCKLNASDWTGLGIDNIIEIPTDKTTNAMSLSHLEDVLAELRKSGTPVISVVCTMGTTDAFAVDPVTKVRALLDRYPNPAGCGAPFLYCDAVIGWSWLVFAKYDFDANPLGFSDQVKGIILENYEAVKGMLHADAIGCDFHKVGWAPYNCSLFMVRDYKEYKDLMSRPGSQYLQERTTYNPGLYTLEVSRAGAYSMAAWSTLKFFGCEGFQAVLGGILEMQHCLRALLALERSLVCVNEDDHGFVTLFRIYPEGVDAKAQYRRELTDPSAKGELKANNKLQQTVADQLWNWLRSGQKVGSAYAPYISYTSGFRPTNYNADEQDPDAVIYALKSFPMNLNIKASDMETLVQAVLAARDVAPAPIVLDTNLGCCGNSVRGGPYT